MSGTAVNIMVESEHLPPGKFPLEDAAQILDVFVCLVRSADPDALDEEMEMSLESLGLSSVSFTILLSERALAAWRKFLAFQRGERGVTLPAPCNHYIVDLNRFINRINAKLSCSDGQGGFVIWQPGEMLRRIETLLVSFDTVLYGHLLNVGGARPNAHIRLLKERRVMVCHLRGRDLARQLASRLYSVVGLRGRAEYNGSELASFRAVELLPYRIPQELSALDGLRSIVSKKFQAATQNAGGAQ
ncbi:MAG: hypothetical protein A2X49_14115 [Lentisphaerae bacterium GWF2_52_8]|nr:MAG: hypothetical protein A2X49_14115 [Lentisphaerae bacterium GWF2_52_8]